MNLVSADIVEHILDSYGHWWPRDFCRLALISSVWLSPVQKRLYACPNLISYHSCHNLARTLECNPRIIELVRGLVIQPKSGSSWLGEGREKHIRGMCPGVPRLLALMRVDRLTLGGDLALSAHRYLRLVASPQTIRTLNITPPCLGVLSNPQMEPFMWDGELASRFYALESLTLHGPLLLDIDDSRYEFDGDIKHSANVLEQGCTIKDLHLQEVEFTDNSGPLCALLCGPGSWCRLSSLAFSTHICANQGLGHLFSVLAVAHNSLEQLRVCIPTTATTQLNDLSEQLKIITPLCRLRSLAISYELMCGDFQRIISDVETLDITGAFGSSHILDWVALIESERPIAFQQNLHRLVIRLSTSPTRFLPRSHSIFTALREACERRSIKLDFVC